MTDRSTRGASAAWNAVRIAAGDDVAVALSDLERTARVRIGDTVVEHAVRGRIPMGHKFALTDLPAGSEIRKYGEPIGVLSAPVMAGEHVHVHNLRSRRARQPG